MRIATQITPDDYRDFLSLPAIAGRRARHGWTAIISLVLVFTLLLFNMGAFFWALGLLGQHDDPSELLHRPRIVILVLSGLILTPVAFLWMKHAYRLPGRIKAELKNPLDDAALKDGVTVGDVSFDVDEDGLRSSLALVRDSYAWRAFRGLVETDRCFFLMIDAGQAEIVPKRAFADGDSVRAFRDFVESRIGGGS